MRRRKRKLNKNSKKPEIKREGSDSDSDQIVSAAAKFAQAVDVVTLNLREEENRSDEREERVSE